MTELDDHELLAEFARNESEAAFATLVSRYVNLVYSTALRFTGNPHNTEEITQAVFIILARKAGSLHKGTVLSGWLYQTARLTAANFVKGEIRRQRREQEAYMQSTLTETDSDAWEQIAPFLEEAMGDLGEVERNAVVLRFFENKTAAEIAAALKLTEAAAHKRVNRALEKLRTFFTRRGVTLATTIIAGTISANSVQAAPAGLSATFAATAVKGTALSTTLATLVKGTMKTMTWMKLKFALAMGMAALVFGGAATLAISQTSSGGDKVAAQEIARRSRDVYAALSSYSDTGKTVSVGAGHTITTTFNTKLQRPNFYRIDWTQTTDFYASKGVVWSEGTGDFWVMGVAGQEENAKAEKAKDMQTALISATAASSSLMSTIPGLFFELNLGNVLKAADLTRQNDEKVNGVDCYVLSSGMDAGKGGKTTTTYWIGKQDYFIHQSRMTMENINMAAPSQISDADIKRVLEMQNKPATPADIAAMRPLMEETSKATQKLMNSGKFVYTQTHGNISVNEKFSASDFAR